MMRSLSAVATLSMVLFTAASANAATWLCDYTGNYTSAGSAAQTPFTWKAHWDTDGAGYRLGGQYTDASGSATMDGTCKSAKCWVSWVYQSGKYAGKTYHIGGPYIDAANGTSTLTFTWGSNGVADVSSGGTFTASGVCKKQ